MSNILLLIVAILFSAAALLVLLTSIKMKFFAEKASFRIVGFKEEREEKDGEVRLSYRPEYMILDGQRAGQTVFCSGAEREPSHAIGDVIAGLVSQNSDGTPYVSSEASLKGNFGMAAFLSVFAAILWFFFMQGLVS